MYRTQDLIANLDPGPIMREPSKWQNVKSQLILWLPDVYLRVSAIATISRPEASEILWYLSMHFASTLAVLPNLILPLLTPGQPVR